VLPLFLLWLACDKSLVRRRRPSAADLLPPSPRRSRRLAGSGATPRSTAGRRPAKAPTPGAASQLAAAIARQPAEVWGFALVVLGVLLALGIHLNLLGLAGREVRLGTYRVLGWGADVLPASLVAAGAVLVARRARRGAAGVLFATLVLAVVSAALADLAAGAPPYKASWPVLEGAGGAAGALIGGPLRSLLGSGGTAVVLGALALAAICPLLGTSVAGVARAIGSATARTWAWSKKRRVAAGEARAAWRAAEAARVAELPPAAAERTRPQRPTSAQVEAEVGDEQDDPARTEGGIFDSALADVDDTPPDVPPHPPEQATGLPPADAVAPGHPEQLSLGIVPAGVQWKLPPDRLLKLSKAQDFDRAEVEARGKVLERALAAHGVETHLVGFTVGPTVTRFELELGAGVKVARVTSLAKDIAYAMASADVRILAPIPGRSAIGVEVPNRTRQLVTLGDVLAAPESRRARHPLEVPIGRDIAGRAVVVNLTEMPHLLIAGATGAGKSSCINSLITSILCRSTPEQVRLILVDPKRVELGQYNALPHLLAQVVVNPKRASNALSWAVAEMERRYDVLAEVGMRDIGGYNAAVDRGDFIPDPNLPTNRPPRRPEPEQDLEPVEEAAEELLDEPAAEPEAEQAEPAAPAGRERLPYILVVIDELNDLMMVAARDVEESICRLAQMARAVGIHLVIATQRPSVDVITGVIKANIPSRLAFSVSSLADSRVILDQPGAERLIGSGDMLLLTASSSVARRLQGPWVTEQEVHAVAGHWRRQSGARYLPGVEGESGEARGEAAGSDDDDELLRRAMELVVRSQLGSTSMLQRKLRVGFARAGRLMDLLERRGVVGPSEGSRARAVLMTPEELDQLERP
jgi:S-DNA-T family DNA segregation ATPase FtsK/SpoIIIE